MPFVEFFYSAPVALSFSAIAILLIGFLCWKGKGRQIVLGLGLFLYLRYLVWRGLFTLNLDDALSIFLSCTLLVAEVYGLVQYVFFSYQAWSPTDRRPRPLQHLPSVDIFVTVVDEPLQILKRTLVGCLEQDYPKNKFQVFVLDDGPRENVQALAKSLGCHYLRRQDRLHAKAGNLNYGLGHSSGDLVAVFDVDHVPVRNFLQDTVGFLEDETVAFVQTPHHFYNQDIFQRNLRLERYLKNEQALFFRMLQAGRDRHNSAFFAGSGGLFRRTSLTEIGGFQTGTLTEDLHTSLLLHAKGYKSCYLNKIVSAGLMPENFEDYLKQRCRWAIGCCQVLLKDNPLTKRWLTFPQRIDYFASIYYFFFGLPRIVFLAAPLAWLFFDLPLLHADIAVLLHLFGSYYLASAISIGMISGGTRNAFWADVYEVAMCFALSRAVVTTLCAPWKRRHFDVTPKGQRIEKKGMRKLTLVLPHLMFAGLLIIGLVLGIQKWMRPTEHPGLALSVFWASANLLLLAVAILSASERPQLRHAIRLNRQFPCQIMTEHETIQANTLDCNEWGLGVSVTKPVLPRFDWLRVNIQIAPNEQISVRGRIIRQEQNKGGDFHVGVRFADLDDSTIKVVIQTLFSSSDSWNESLGEKPRLLQSLWLLVHALGGIRDVSSPRRRRIPRGRLQKTCQLFVPGLILRGTTQDISLSGLSALFPGEKEPPWEMCVLDVGGVSLKVFPIFSFVRRSGQTLMGFRIEGVERGEQEWHALYGALWQRSH